MVLRRTTTDYEIFEGDFGEIEEKDDAKDTEKDLQVGQNQEEGLIKQLTEMEVKQEFNIIEDSATTTPDIDGTTPEPDVELEQTPEQQSKGEGKDTEKVTKTHEDSEQDEKQDEEYDFTDSDEDEFIKLIIMDDTELEKDQTEHQTTRIGDSVDAENK
uniref:Uncharacterized protein n=2 Tax=Cacopsylla melanoneura TaxID=428564 RepID=A0A8D8SUJ4_9HEMI